MSGYKRAAKSLSTAFFSQMAALKNRRQLKLSIALPPATTTACSPLPLLPPPPPPLPPSLPATTNNTAILDLEKLCLLGHGNGGSVFQVRHKHSSAVYALKVVPNECDDNARRQIIREIEVLRCTTDSPFVVRCYGNFEKPCGEISLLLEYMDAGSLDSLLKAKGPFSETSLTHIARQVLSGLNYLHMLKVIHRDIKPSNLLVNQKMEVKIADFGVSKIMSKGVDLCKSYVGTCAYMSPERFDPETYGLRYNGYAADIWSFGLSMLELYMGFLPVLAGGQKPDWATLMCALCFEDSPSAPETASEDFRSFIHCCLQKDANKRWTAAQLLSHPFVAKNGRN